MKQGEIGDEFFFINDGTADVLKIDGDKEVKVASLRSPDYFGEHALMENDVRSASVKATSDLEVLVLSQQEFKTLKSKDDVLFAKRRAVAVEGLITHEAAPPTMEHPSDVREFIKSSIKKNLLFENSEEVLVDRIVPYMHPETFKKGDNIIQEGETQGTKFYCLHKGSVKV